MKNIKPCPYCGGEVEVVRMPNLKGQKTYRISCNKCHALVARGMGFEIETISEAEDRIQQYEAEVNRQIVGKTNVMFKQKIVIERKTKPIEFNDY